MPESATLGAHAAVSRAHALWQNALASNSREAALEQVAAVEALSQVPQDLSPQWSAMRLWRVETAFRSGDVDGAAAMLADLERLDGRTYRTRFIKARMAYFRGRFEDAASSCADALILLPMSKAPTKSYDVIIRFQAECLCLLGRHDEARSLLTAAFAHKPSWSTDDIKALRKTVHDEISLGAMYGFLAPYFSHRGIRSRVALYHYSMACRDLGFYDRAELAIRQRFVSAAQLERFGARPSTSGVKPDWLDDARQTLADLKAVTDSADTEVFLISGTLLGAVREGDILGHDKDIDVGIMESATLDKARVENAFRNSGRFSVKPYQVPTLLRVQHASGVMVDIFWHRQENGLIIHEGMKSKWWNQPFELMDFSFLGATHKIPRNFGRYLGENYGNWEKPDSEFETFVDTPNMIVTNEGEIVWYYYCKLFDYYNRGKVAQFRKVAGALVDLRPGDIEVQDIVHRALSQAAPQPHEEPLEDIDFAPLPGSAHGSSDLAAQRDREESGINA